jgi:hypothetical protein
MEDCEEDEEVVEEDELATPRRAQREIACSTTVAIAPSRATPKPEPEDEDDEDRVDSGRGDGGGKEPR